jgi:CHAD domain-containing protein
MAFSLEPHQSTKRELGRSLREECQAAREALTSPDPEEKSPIHDARKHLKKVRATLRLMGIESHPKCETLAECLRQAAHDLGPVRDREANLDTLARLGRMLRLSPDCLAVADRIVRGSHDEESAIASAMANATAAIARAEARLPGADPFLGGARTAARGLAKSYRRARRARRGLEPASEAPAFHEWRKCVKDLMYQCRLFTERSRPAAKRERQLSVLGEILGRHHNMETLRLALQAPDGIDSSEPHIEKLIGSIVRRETTLAARALRLGAPLFRTRPSRFKRQSKRWTSPG